MLTRVLETLGKLFGAVGNVTDPKQHTIKTVKRLKYQLEAAQNYIFVDEASGEYKGLGEGKVKKLKLHYRKRAFDSQ